MTVNFPMLKSTIGTMLQYTDTNDPNLAIITQAIVNDAEGRIYRELDFLATRKNDASGTVTINSRSFTLPTVLISLYAMSIITPAASTPVNGVRNRVQLINRDAIDFIWPQEIGTTPSGVAATGLPKWGAMQDDRTVILAPTPDAAYKTECYGLWRPTPMSGSNLTSYIGDNYPDLLVAASMVFATGYQRDFGSMADDPKMAMSWEAHYQTLKQSALDEEKRRKGESTGGSPSAPPPVTTPAQG